MMDDTFWTHLDTLLHTSELVIDRPKGSAHPHHATVIYPLDYGYLHGAMGDDGEGLDVWRGSLPEGCLDAVVCTVDLRNRDAEIKLLLGCTAREKQTICAFHTGASAAALLVHRHAADGGVL
jgi:inorganic pyrophosphatase